MSAELVLEIGGPAAVPLRVEWDEDALAARGAEGAGGLWRLDRELDWDRIEALRVLSARIDDGRAIAVVTLRPAAAAGHDEELVAGAIVTDGVAEELAEVLVSTEYGVGSEIRRIGLELYREQDGAPLRLAGDQTATTTEIEDGVRRLRVVLGVRLGGASGAGVLEVLTRP